MRENETFAHKTLFKYMVGNGSEEDGEGAVPHLKLKFGVGN